MLLVFHCKADSVARLGSINPIGGGGLSPPGGQVHPFQITMEEPTQLGCVSLVIIGPN